MDGRDRKQRDVEKKQGRERESVERREAARRWAEAKDGVGRGGRGGMGRLGLFMKLGNEQSGSSLLAALLRGCCEVIFFLWPFSSACLELYFF